MKVLGIESSCDETGLAVYDTEAGSACRSTSFADRSARRIWRRGAGAGLARPYRRLPLIVRQALQAGLVRSSWMPWPTPPGPGLAGALLVGASFAESLALRWDSGARRSITWRGICCRRCWQIRRPEFPFVALAGVGRAHPVDARDGVGRYELLGETVDDAAGEAFDKTANCSGWAIRAGRQLSKLAESGRCLSLQVAAPDAAFRRSGFQFQRAQDGGADR
jgi:N6-L-threonylcarbamoyladenine synthase